MGLDQLFGTKQPIAKPQAPKQVDHTGSILSVLQDIRADLAKWQTTQNTPEPVGEIITLQAGQSTSFDAHGYRHNALYVNDSDAANTTINVKVGGVTYTQSLVPGINQTNFPDGADLKPSNTITVYLVRTNYEFVSSEPQEVSSDPRLIATIPASAFTVASTSKWVTAAKVLTRNAKQRTFYIVNTLNESITSESFWITDSVINPSAGNNAGDEASSSSTIATNTTGVFTSETHTQLSTHGDSMQIGLGMGATLPTSGQVQVYVVESF